MLCNFPLVLIILIPELFTVYVIYKINDIHFSSGQAMMRSAVCVEIELDQSKSTAS